MKQIICSYPNRKSEIIRFVKKHHYTRRCPHVWSIAFCIENDKGKIQSVAMYGPAPYPTVAKAFVRNQSHTPHHIWQSRLIGAGISSNQLDELLYFAHEELYALGYWWVHTLTNPTETTLESSLKIFCKGFTGDVYKRTGALYLGIAGKKALSGFVIDGKPVHKRQGSITLTHTNVSKAYPDAKNIRPFYGNAKQRWAYILHKTDEEREQRLLLMTYRPQSYEMMRQPLLLIEIIKLWLFLYKKVSAQ